MSSIFSPIICQTEAAAPLQFRGAPPVIPTSEGDLPDWIQVVPFGTWHGHHSGLLVDLGPDQAAELVTNFNRFAADVPLDYDHRILDAGWGPTDSGIAAGWLDRLEARNDGVWAHVRFWTDRAAAHLRAREYRYLSPVLFPAYTDPVSGDPIGLYLHSVALTNTPFFRELAALVNRQGPSSTSPRPAHLPATEEPPMLTWICALLNLTGEDATEENAQAGISDLHARHVAATAALGIEPGADVSTIAQAGKALTARASLGDVVIAAQQWTEAIPDDADTQLTAALSHEGFVPLADHVAAVAEKETAAQTASDAAFLDAAVREGRISPAEREVWAEQMQKGHGPSARRIISARAPASTVPLNNDSPNNPPVRPIAPATLAHAQRAGLTQEQLVQASQPGNITRILRDKRAKRLSRDA